MQEVQPIRSPQRTRLAFWLVGYTVVALGIGSNLPTPLFVLYQSRWHIPLHVLTQVFAVYDFAVIPSILLNGHLSDRFGRRRVLLAALLTGVAASVLFAAAQGVAMLFVAEIIQGIAIGAFLGTATAALSELEPRGNHRKAALVSSVAVACGTAGGPVFAGVMAQYAPWPLVLPYLAHLLLLTPALLLVRSLPETVAQRAPAGGSRAVRLGVPVQIRGLFAICAVAGFAGWAVTGLFLATGPVLLAQLLNIHNLALSAGFVFLMLGASAVTQILFRGIPLATAMVVAMGLLTFGLGLMVTSFREHVPVLFLCATLVSGAGAGLSFMSSLGTVNVIAPPEQRGGVVSSMYVVFYLGVSIPVVILGWAADRFGLEHAAPLFGTALAVMAALVGLLCGARAIQSQKLTYAGGKHGAG